MKINLKGTKNTRDLGGFYQKSNIFIKEHCFIRSDCLSNLTKEDVSILKDEYQLKTIFDFRNQDEVDKAKDVEITNIHFFHLPLNPGEDKLEGVSSKDENQNLTFKEKLMLMYKKGESHPAFKVMENNYKTLLTHPYSISQFKFFLRYLINNKAGEAVLYHCAGGKDRTGVASVLILTLLGVSKDEIVKDYLLTNEYVDKNVYKDIEKYRSTDEWIKAEILEATCLAHKQYIDLVYDILEKDGEPIEYIKKNFDITDEDIFLLRDKYLIKTN